MFEGWSILEPYSPAKPVIGKSEVVILEKKMLLENATSNLRCKIAARSHLPLKTILTDKIKKTITSKTLERLDLSAWHHSILAPFRSTQCSGFCPFSRNALESLKKSSSESVNTTLDTTQFFLKMHNIGHYFAAVIGLSIFTCTSSHPQTAWFYGETPVSPRR